MVSDRLAAAVAIVDRWPDWPSSVVILAGPSGTGKSHLAAIWREKAQASNLISRNDESEAIATAAAGPVLIEDVERGGFSDAFLFHLINAVRQNGTSLMMTTRLWPAAWDVTLPDLASRLKAATVVEIGAPDDELLVQVVHKLFADRQLAVDEKIVSYLVARMERSLAAAQEIVGRIDRLALSRGSRVTRAVAAEVLGTLDAGTDETS